MRYRAFVALFLFGLLPCTARADSPCMLVLTSVDVIWVGDVGPLPMFFIEPRYELFCSIDVYGSGGGQNIGGGGDPIDSGGGSDFPAPSLSLTSVSDADPKNVLVRVIVNDADTLNVFVNGIITKSFSPPPSFVLLGSLAAVPSGVNEIGFQARNSVATIVRSFSALRAPQNYYGGEAVNVAYEYVLGDPTTVGYDSYQRLLSVNALYTSYSLATEGARNGRVEHETVTDEMQFLSTTWIQPPTMLTWISQYEMTDVDFSEPVQLGVCGAFSHCGAIHRFAVEGYPDGAARMQAATSTAAAGVPGIAAPLKIDVRLDH